MLAYRGDTWSQTFRFTPLDLTTAVVASWITDVEGNITYLNVTTDAPSGAVTIELPPDVAAGHYDYDVEVTDGGGVVTTWVRGKLTVALDVTNAPPPSLAVAVGG